MIPSRALAARIATRVHSHHSWTSTPDLKAVMPSMFGMFPNHAEAGRAQNLAVATPERSQPKRMVPKSWDLGARVYN
jgi:hypothetical protein